MLYDAFENGIKDLKAIFDTNQKKCERIEMIYREEEKKQWIKVAMLLKTCKEAQKSFYELDKNLDKVADKVVYLGEQLEGVNTPRNRAVEAQKLIKHFDSYLNGQENVNNFFEEELDEESINELYSEADMIQKLYLISQELPAHTKFDQAKESIIKRYNIIEKQLINEFENAQKNDDKIKMKRIAFLLFNFKGYTQCMDVFIEQSHMGIFLCDNIFNDIVQLSTKNYRIIKEVFPNPEQVMSKFILNVFQDKIRKYILSKLDEDKDDYLMELYNLFSKTTKLINQLSVIKFLGCDHIFLEKISRNMFSQHLESYFSLESKFLREKCESILHFYYESKNHQKRAIPSGAFELIQSKIGRTNINIGNLGININSSNMDSNTDTLLSEEIAISILQETKMSLNRCQLLSKPHEIAQNVLALYNIELKYLCIEHIDYAIEIGLQSIPSPDSKSQPEINFFEIVRQCSEIHHLTEKQFTDTVLPLISTTTKYTECLKKKKEISLQIEIKINSGLEKSMNTIVGWIKYLLQSEQKKSDFKSEPGDELIPTSTTVSRILHVIHFHAFCLILGLFESGQVHNLLSKQNHQIVGW